MKTVQQYLKVLPSRELLHLGFSVWIAFWLIAGFFTSPGSFWYYLISLASGAGYATFLYYGWSATKQARESERLIGWIYVIIGLVAALFWILNRVSY